MELKSKQEQDNFDVSKLSNTKFKLDYIALEKHGEQKIVDIAVTDIASKIDFCCNMLCVWIMFSLLYDKWICAKVVS